jgi:23S rRNA (cytidine2498-2'-O)-methyltransferase
MVVDAVDPAALHPTVRAHPRVTHHRQRAEAWMASRSSGAGPSLLVNDMRMDADVAARLLVDMAAAMAPGGRLITTLKLPARGLVPAMTRALTTLGKGWRVDAVRHLFHNRTEVTVLGTVRAP